MEGKKKTFLFINQTPKSQFFYWAIAWSLLLFLSSLLTIIYKRPYTQLAIFSSILPVLISHYFLQIKFKKISMEVWPHLHGLLTIFIAVSLNDSIGEAPLFISLSLYSISLLRIYGFYTTLTSGLAYLAVSLANFFYTNNNLSFKNDAYLILMIFFILLFSVINGLVKEKVETLEEQSEDLAKKNSNLNQYLEKFWDLTSHFKEQNQKLKDLDQQKTNFFQSLSHEIRTPITLIETPLNQCHKKYPEDKDLKVALKNSTRLHHLVNQLLNFQKAIVNKSQLKLSPINLIKFCENIASLFSSTCESNKLGFKFLIGSEPFNRINIEDYRFYLEVNLDSLEKIIFNLLDNAFKYSPREGVITLSISKKDHHLRIGVEDEGPGVPKKNHNKIFQSFIQIENNSNEKGTGLGLSLVKELAETMKGKVGIESDGKKGSFFWVDFPSYNPRNVIDFVLIVPKKENTSNYRKLFLNDFTWEKINTLKELKNFSNLFYPKIILIDPRLEDSQENLELWEDITDSIPDSYFLSLEKGDKIDGELKSIIKEKASKSLIKDRPILFDYELRDLLIISKKDVYLKEYSDYREAIHKKAQNPRTRTVDYVQTISEAKKKLKGNKYRCLLIDLGQFEIEGIHLLKFSHLISSLTKKVAMITPETLKRKKKDIIDVPYIDRYFLSFDFGSFIKVIEDYIQSSKIISTESYNLKNWIFEYKKKSDDGQFDETEPFYELNKEELKSHFGVGLTLLVIDNLKDMRLLLKDILIQHGYKVVLCKSATEGKAKLNDLRPDLIIVDWMLGEINGVEFIKEVKKRPETKTTPIILFTAKSDEESRSIGVQSGADGFLGKPFNEVELESMVRNLTRLKEKEKKLTEKTHNLLLSKMEMDYLMDEVYGQQKSQKQILNTIPEALIMFDKKGVVFEEGSKASEEIFGITIFKSDLLNPDDKLYIWDILKLNDEEIEIFQKWLKKVYESKMNFKDLIDLAPKTFQKNKGKYIELIFKPIYSLEDQKSILKLVLIGKDRTLEKSLEKNVKKEQQNNKLLRQSLESPTEFIEILQDLQNIKNVYNNLKNQEEDFFRFIHTLKARMSFFIIPEFIQKIHEMEGLIFKKDEKNLIQLINTFYKDINNFIKDNSLLIEYSKKYINEGDKSINIQELLKLFSNFETVKEIEENIYKDYVLSDIKSNFKKFKTYTEEISLVRGKLVEFEIKGEDIKINQIKLKSFLNSSLHLFRNMIDHGIEEESIRVQKNKPKEGKIKTNFALENDIIEIKFEDDGAGIDIEKIKIKCLENNILTAEDFNKLSKQEIVQLIFKPRFSTKSSIDLLSGRGIGMETFKNEVDNLNGSLEVRSEKDEGTTFIIKIPLKEVS